MYRDPLHAIVDLHMIRHLRSDNTGVNHTGQGSFADIIVGRNRHRKKRIRIVAKRFPVEEVAPASHDLSDQKSHRNGIRKYGELHLPLLRKDDCNDHACDHTTVDGKSAAPDINQIEQRLPQAFALYKIRIPAEYNIVESGT